LSSRPWRPPTEQEFQHGRRSDKKYKPNHNDLSSSYKNILLKEIWGHYQHVSANLKNISITAKKVKIIYLTVTRTLGHKEDTFFRHGERIKTQKKTGEPCLARENERPAASHLVPDWLQNPHVHSDWLGYVISKFVF